MSAITDTNLQAVLREFADDVGVDKYHRIAMLSAANHIDALEERLEFYQEVEDVSGSMD